MKTKIEPVLTAMLASLAGVGLLAYPQQAAEGAKNGIGYCLDILIPSLFPFMVLAVFVVKCGLAGKLGNLLERPVRFLFKLPGSAAAAILMSMVGGYPVGARSIAALHAAGELDDAQASRMLCFCVNAGPAFVISVVGIGFLKSAQAGMILFASQVFSSTVLGLLCGLAAQKLSSPPKKKAFHIPAARKH